MPKVIKKPDPTEPNPVVKKVREFIGIKGRIEDLTKEKAVLQSELSDLVDAEGIPDEKGHLWYELPEDVDGIHSLQRQRRVSQRLDEDVADKILKDKGLASRCYVLVPQLVESEVMACLYEGTLTEDDIDAMYPKSVSYAFLPSKS